MAFDAYLKVPGVDGESRRKDFEKQIEIFSFSLGAQSPTSIGAGGGRGGGKVSLSLFSFTKWSDVASAAFFQACCTGTQFAKATLTLRKVGGSRSVDVLRYEFENVSVESLNWAGSSADNDVPLEAVSFAFDKVTVTYTPQTATGARGNAVVGSCDRRPLRV